MSTIAEIENALVALPDEDKYAVYRFLEVQLRYYAPPQALKHGVLDIAPVHLGPVLQPLTRDDDLLDEMLEERL